MGGRGSVRPSGHREGWQGSGCGEGRVPAAAESSGSNDR